MEPLLLSAAAVAMMAVATREYVRRSRRRSRTRLTLSLWAGTPADGRAAALKDLVGRDYRAAGAWYLLACLHARRGEFALAARLFGMAHHVDPDLTSAALLTFTCLKAAAAPALDQVKPGPILAQTWDEMNRPPLGESALEQTIWRALDPADRTPTADSPLPHLARMVFGEAA